MRRMDFTTEHVESFQPGETYEVTECVLPSSYYYVLEHALVSVKILRMRSV